MIKKLTEELHEAEADIYLKAQVMDKINPNGSKSFTDGEYKVVITHKNTVKVDQVKASKNPELFKVKYDFDKRIYDESVAWKNIINEAITITPNKPGFSVERL